MKNKEKEAKAKRKQKMCFNNLPMGVEEKYVRFGRRRNPESTHPKKYSLGHIITQS